MQKIILIIANKIKFEGIGSGKVNKDQKVDIKFQDEINKIINTNSLIQESDYTKYVKLIEKVICYGQENINSLKTLKESNIDGFKNYFKKIINYINEEIEEDIKEKIDEVISLLDLFFIERMEKNIKKEELFQNKINDNSTKKKLLIKLSDEQIDLILKETKKYILNSVGTKKENINQLLNSKGYKDIIYEINKEIYKNLEELNQKIVLYLEKYNSELEILFKESKELFKQYSKGKIQIKNF